MTRSHRHTPITGVTTAASDRPSKTRAHKQARARTRAALSRGTDGPHPKETGNPWRDGEKDGKVYRGRDDIDALRK